MICFYVCLCGELLCLNVLVSCIVSDSVVLFFSVRLVSMVCISGCLVSVWLNVWCWCVYVIVCMMFWCSIVVLLSM